MNIGGQQPMQGLAVPIAVTPPIPESTPPPPLSSPDECLAYLMGKVRAFEGEIARLNQDLRWTQEELDRNTKQAEIDKAALNQKHQEDIDRLLRGGLGGKDEPKGADPPQFGGNQRELEGWLTACRMSFANQPSKFGTERKKVLWATTFLTGLPLQAFQPLINKHLAGDDTIGEMTSFETFAMALRGLYGDPNLEPSSKTALHFLQQTGSVAAYYAKFVSHSQYTNLSDNALADYFYRGLNEKIKDKLAEMGPWKGLFDLKARATQYDSRMRERKAEKEFEAKAAGLATSRKPEGSGRYGFNPPPRNPTVPNPYRSPPTAPSSRPPPIPPRPTPTSTTRPSDGATPMELDAQTRSELTSDDCRRMGLCFRCKR
jgi:hypothetical protein